jgi:hypothetical protein
MNRTRDIVFKRCGCTYEKTGRQLAAHCPHLAEHEHGSWYYAVQVSTIGGRKAECQDSMTASPLTSGIWVPSPNRLRCCLDVFGPRGRREGVREGDIDCHPASGL